MKQTFAVGQLCPKIIREFIISTTSIDERKDILQKGGHGSYGTFTRYIEGTDRLLNQKMYDAIKEVAMYGVKRHKSKSDKVVKIIEGK